MWKPDWCKLPGELLTKISEQHLNNRIDVIRFRGVCTSFRSSANFVPPLKLRLPYPASANPLNSMNFEENPSRFCVLLENTIYSVRPRGEAGDSQAWVIKVEKNGLGNVKLVNPLSRVKIKPLPRKFPKVFHLMDFDVVELCKEYVLKNPPSEGGAFLVRIPNSRYYVQVKELNVGELDVKKVAINDVYGVMVLHREGMLIHLSPKAKGNSKWNVIEKGYEFDDVVSYKGKFYSVDRTGKAVVVDTNLKVNVIAEPPMTDGGGTEKRLVISDGNLFLVDMCLYPASDESDGDDDNDEQAESDDEWLDYDEEGIPCEFQVYKLDECKRRWIRVEDLGGRVFVIGERSSFSVCPGDLSLRKGNCIVFTDSLYTSCGAEEDAEVFIHNTGLFNLEDGQIGQLAAFPGYNQLFWPPPPWIMRK